MAASGATHVPANPRIVMDLQGCQTEGSRGRGIGRYSASLARALLATPGDFRYTFALNGAYPDAVREVSEELAAPRDALVTYPAPSSAAYWSADTIDADRVAGERIAEAAWAAARPDVVHVSSIFEAFHGRAVVPPLRGVSRSAVMSTTVYDVIPLVFADVYLADPATRAWYMASLERLRRCDLLLAISEATRRDVIERVGINADRVVTVLGGADGRFSPAGASYQPPLALLQSLGLHKPFVMYTGGIDHRKNVEGLIRAFALLPPRTRDRYQLAIVCKVNDADRLRLAQVAKAAKLPPDALVLTGFVADDALVDLYRTCALFVFPSLYEGFGLPILEAMSCGAPTIAARTSCLPQIVGMEEALFDVGRDEAIAPMLARALDDESFRERLRTHATHRARAFSWADTARRAQDAWKAALERKARKLAMAVADRRPTLALVTPLPPERSGIADFVHELLPHLAEHFDVELFCSESADAERYRSLGYRVQPWQQLPACWTDFEAGVLYQFGNSEFHVHMLGLLQACPGTVLLHDVYLSDLMAYCEFGPPRLAGVFRAMLRYCHGDAAVARYGREGRDATIDAYPMAKWVLDHANGVIVTSGHALDLLASHDQARRARCAVVPHHRKVQPVSDAERQSARADLGVAPGDFLVCSFGSVHERKCSRTLLDAWDIGKPTPSARLVFVGAADGDYGEQLRSAARGRGADVHVTGYVDDDTFHRYMRAADLVVQLRSGSRGEASGAALYAMAYGRPLIVSCHGSLEELPADACVHVDLPVDPHVLAATMRQVAADAERRRALGEHARRWVERACTPGQAADAVAQHVLRFNDPATIHWRDRLTALAKPSSSSMGQGSATRIADLSPRIEALHRATAPPHDATIERAFAALLPRVISTAGSAADRASLQPSDALEIPAADPRLQTACGTKVDGIIVSNGHPGVLLFGPYLAIEAGTYRVRVYGEAAGSPGKPFGMLEAVAEGGRKQLASSEVADRSGRGSLDGFLGRVDFVASQSLADLEIRVIIPGSTRMAIESIDVIPLGASQSSAPP